MPTNTNTKTDWKTNRLGGLWKNKSQKGDAYLKGGLKFPFDVKAGQQVDIIAFSNKDKKTDSQPDINVYFAESREATKQVVTQSVETKTKVVPTEQTDNSEVF
jgi:uncharacterized protein (DUF736 family)